MATRTKRYGAYGKNQVHDWEMWNEPYLYEFWYIPWDPENANASMYAQLIKRARAEIDRYDPGGRLLAGGVSDIRGPAFLRRLWASDWGPCIFDGSIPIWKRESIDPSPFYLAFQGQALTETPPTRPELEQPPESDLSPLRPEFSWQRPTPGELPIVGDKLQVDDSLYRGQSHFHSPELDVWVPAALVHFLPLQMIAGGATTTTAAAKPAPPTIPEISQQFQI